MRSEVVNVGLIGLLVISMISYIDEWGNQSLNVEGRLGTLELVLSSICQRQPSLDGCDIVNNPVHYD